MSLEEGIGSDFKGVVSEGLRNGALPEEMFPLRCPGEGARSYAEARHCGVACAPAGFHGGLQGDPLVISEEMNHPLSRVLSFPDFDSAQCAGLLLGNPIQGFTDPA